jgi:hypothetical protein
MAEKKQYTIEYLREAHKLSIFNKEGITASDVCGCFYCKTTFDSDKVVEWTDIGHAKGSTALCPNCGIDAVIGSSSNFPISNAIFLEEMHSYWF